jgi:hypothetical protein
MGLKQLLPIDRPLAARPLPARFKLFGSASYRSVRQVRGMKERQQLQRRFDRSNDVMLAIPERAAMSALLS